MKTDRKANPFNNRRYSGHHALAQIGTEGQRLLSEARVLCVGAGAIGSAALTYLAASGIGVIGIADFDVVSESNLGRQTLHFAEDLGKPKVISAAEKLGRLNSDCDFEIHKSLVTESNARALVLNYDLVIDGTDNFETKYLLNQTCCALNVPLIMGSIFQTEGQLTTFRYLDGPCYECLYPNTSDRLTSEACSEVGVLSPLPGIVGSLIASEAIKAIAGFGVSLDGRLTIVDTETGNFSMAAFNRDPSCQVCSTRTDRSLGNYPHRIDSSESLNYSITVQEVLELQTNEAEFLLFDLRPLEEFRSSRIPNSLAAPISSLSLAGLQIAFEAALIAGKQVILYCHNEFRSRRVQRIMSNKGIHTRVLSGGIAEWIRNALPLDKANQ